MFTRFDDIADFEIRTDIGHVHISDGVVFERAVEDFCNDDHAAVPSTVIERERVNEPITRDEDLSRESAAIAFSFAGSLVLFSEFALVFAGFSDQRNFGAHDGVDDGAHAIIGAFLDDTDIVAAVFAVSGLKLAHEITVRVGLSETGFNGETRF